MDDFLDTRKETHEEVKDDIEEETAILTTQAREREAQEADARAAAPEAAPAEATVGEGGER